MAPHLHGLESQAPGSQGEGPLRPHITLAPGTLTPSWHHSLRSPTSFQLTPRGGLRGSAVSVPNEGGAFHQPSLSEWMSSAGSEGEKERTRFSRQSLAPSPLGKRGLLCPTLRALTVLSKAFRHPQTACCPHARGRPAAPGKTLLTLAVDYLLLANFRRQGLFFYRPEHGMRSGNLCLMNKYKDESPGCSNLSWAPAG